MNTSMLPFLIIIGIATFLTVLVSIIFTMAKPFNRRNGALLPCAAIIIYAVAAAHLVIFCYAAWLYRNPVSASYPADTSTVETTEEPTTDATTATDASTETTTPPTTVPVETEPPFAPAATDKSDPSLWNVTWEIMVNDEIVESYQREEPIYFGEAEEYFALPGVATFRGNNYRNSPTYGTAEVTSGVLSKVWSNRVGFLESNRWIGCAWTGQPLVVQWDEETKQNMNLYDHKKAKENLVEVIYAKLDGKVHFYDLEDGTETRDPIKMGMIFKGAGALDPRGYPVLYLGGGVSSLGKEPRIYVVSLIDGEVLYTFGNDDDFALRNWTAFDSSPLVDAETDTLIWPGENGVLYTIKLNSNYDKEAGTFTVEPSDLVKTRYTSDYSENKNRYLGYESSASIVGNYMFTSENGGLFQCIDLNTMNLVWVQDTLDDSNSSPLFDWGEDGRGYIYTAPSLHWTQVKHAGEIPIYKLDAQTGEVIWTYTADCVTYDEISGGVQSSPLLGKVGSDIEGLIFYAIGRTPGAWEGKLVALDKETGETVWEASTGNYTWSSPVAVYTEDGKSYIFLANASGVCRLYDGLTGEILSSLNLKQTVEASPVVYGNMIVLGSREGVYGIKVS